MECRLRQLKYSKTRNWQSRGYRIENLSIPGWKAGDPYEAVKEPWLNTLVDISWDSTSWASQVTLVVKNLAVNADGHKRCEFNPWVGKIPWCRAWELTAIFLSGELCGQRNLVDYSP